ncbi:MAG: hypothetical protein NTV65_07480 [Proteobacteria bacterium]|nr:hypothetical protein [Pseudomonadota bacterium]
MIDSENIADPKAGMILREDLRYGIVSEDLHFIECSLPSEANYINGNIMAS